MSSHDSTFGDLMQALVPSSAESAEVEHVDLSLPSPMKKQQKRPHSSPPTSPLSALSQQKTSNKDIIDLTETSPSVQIVRSPMVHVSKRRRATRSSGAEQESPSSRLLRLETEAALNDVQQRTRWDNVSHLLQSSNFDRQQLPELDQLTNDQPPRADIASDLQFHLLITEVGNKTRSMECEVLQSLNHLRRILNSADETDHTRQCLIRFKELLAKYDTKSMALIRVIKRIGNLFAEDEVSASDSSVPETEFTDDEGEEEEFAEEDFVSDDAEGDEDDEYLESGEEGDVEAGFEEGEEL